MNENITTILASASPILDWRLETAQCTCAPQPPRERPRTTRLVTRLPSASSRGGISDPVCSQPTGRPATATTARTTTHNSTYSAVQRVGVTERAHQLLASRLNSQSYFKLTCKGNPALHSNTGFYSRLCDIHDRRKNMYFSKKPSGYFYFSWKLNFKLAVQYV